jgi:hypothetical protein
MTERADERLPLWDVAHPDGPELQIMAADEGQAVARYNLLCGQGSTTSRHTVRPGVLRALPAEVPVGETYPAAREVDGLSSLAHQSLEATAVPATEEKHEHGTKSHTRAGRKS